MKLTQFAALAIALSCSACTNSAGPNTEGALEKTNENQVKSEINQIEKAFERGDNKTACKLQVRLSKDLEDYKTLSPNLLKSLKELQVKCTTGRLLTIDFETR